MDATATLRLVVLTNVDCIEFVCCRFFFIYIIIIIILLYYRVIDSIEDQLQLQKDLAALEAWAADWGMQFNHHHFIILFSYITENTFTGSTYRT